MKKLRALFAILLAVCMLCSMAFAEEVAEVEEVVLDEVVVTEAAADVEETADAKDDNHDSKVETTETVNDTTPTGDGDGKEHNVDGDPKETRTYASQLHEGEKVQNIEDLIAGKKGTIVAGKYEVYQEFDCEKGQAGIYRFQCMVNKVDDYGNPIWHEFIIPAEHKWASEEHETNEDWGKIVGEANCLTGGKAQDYCLRCGTTRELYRDVAPMGHSFENADDNLRECPHCHGHHIDTLQRITGYLVGTTNRWNSGKLAELHDRVVHE